MQSNQEINLANLKQYLLSNLPPPETEAIDLQIISDENAEEELLWAESELMEDYLDSALSPPEVELFEENFLVSSERRAQLRQISLVRNFARNCATKGASEKAFQASPGSFYEKLKIFFRLNLRPLTAVAALAIVGLFVAFYFAANDQTASEREFAELNQKNLSDSAELKSLANLNLMSGAFRNSGDVRKLAADKLTERVSFQLALPVQSNAPDKFIAELVKDGRVIFTQHALPFYNNSSGQEIRLLLPSAVLIKGAYQIKLSKETAPESAFVYNFAVE